MTDLASDALRDQLDQLLLTARRVAESLDLDTVLSSIVEDATTSSAPTAATSCSGTAT